jgi:hypothetical protein
MSRVARVARATAISYSVLAGLPTMAIVLLVGAYLPVAALAVVPVAIAAGTAYAARRTPVMASVAFFVAVTASAAGLGLPRFGLNSTSEVLHNLRIIGLAHLALASLFAVAATAACHDLWGHHAAVHAADRG